MNKADAPNIGPNIGIDEVGRGCLAGPVVAVAFFWEPTGKWCKELHKTGLKTWIRDSKTLSAKQRERVFAFVEKRARWFLGQANVEEIDTLNIHAASLLAMERALEGLWAQGVECQDVIVDGKALSKRLKEWGARACVGGDALYPAVSAASIVAKVSRDRFMDGLEKSFPGYGFQQHKGYPTSQHKEALARIGVSPHHRLSFAPCKAVLDQACFPASV